MFHSQNLTAGHHEVVVTAGSSEVVYDLSISFEIEFMPLWPGEVLVTSVIPSGRFRMS